MATRSRRTWKLDKQGQYARQIGWKISRGGKRSQHKFRLGDNLKEAKRREQRLRDLWEQVEAACTDMDAVWTDESLDIAKQIEKGAVSVEVPQHEDEDLKSYAARVHRAQRRYPSVPITPQDQENYAIGAIVQRGDHEVNKLARDTAHELAETLDTESAIRSGALPSGAATSIASLADSRNLHEAFDEFVAWVKQDYFRPALDRVNDTGMTIVRQMGTLKERHDDVQIGQLDFDTIEAMIQKWRQRPFKKGTKQPISRVSAKNYIGTLKRFFKWLHQSKNFDWRKPEDFESISTRIEAVPGEQQRRLAQVKTFGIEELTLLNKFATPLERAFLLLAVNCGFGVKELATLTAEEVVLFCGHSKREQEILGIETTNADSFIKRIRRKNVVYGEWILFPQTVEAIQWAIERRRSLAKPGDNSILLLNKNGEPYDKPTKGGHRNQQIPNRFSSLVRRIQETHPSFPKLSFGKLRKTAGDLIRRFGDGEVSGLFLCHGQAVKTDDLADIYTNRPFGKVFDTIRKVEHFLQPMFEAAGPSPFRPDGKTCK